MKEQQKCPFCNIPKEAVLIQNKFCFAIFDKYPVSKGHILIIPFRHFDNYFDATFEEKLAFIDLIDKAKEFLDKEFKPDGYNIGVNIGKEAGQTIFHVHIHLIPRYAGDMENPAGGVRGVIPEKRIYRL
ncbi:MAG: HIT family protein [Aquificae bacterium]|nr:HIT family protein [Aquificota bacterium]